MPNKRILLVEDDRSIRDAIQELLESEGYTVDGVKNGQEAIDLLRSHQDLPRLILLDLMMPIMDGFRFREIQEIDPVLSQIPVVVMSADGQIESKKYKLGAAGYIKKPVDIDDVLKKVEHYFH